MSDIGAMRQSAQSFCQVINGHAAHGPAELVAEATLGRI
jgi:hypothetical protein